MDYDFEKGAELENRLLRLRHEWETKDQRRRAALGHDDSAAAVEEEKPTAANARRPVKSKAESKAPVKRGAHQIF